MFDLKKPIKVDWDIINRIIKIKKEISIELEWFQWDISTEFERLFNLKVSQDEILKNIENIE